MASQPRSGHQEEHTDERLNRPSALEYFDDNANTFRFAPRRGMASGFATPVQLDIAYSPPSFPASLASRTPTGRTFVQRGQFRQLRERAATTGRFGEVCRRISMTDFREITCIGDCKSAKVFVAIESKSVYQVALKRITRAATNKDRIELEIHRSLKHANIISLFGYFDHGPFKYLILEFARFGTLRKELTLKGPFNDSVAAPFIDQILQAVSYCHSKGIIHRDIKPSNILLCDAGMVKLADFGMSVDTRDSIFTLCGTSSYIAPEIIAGEEYDYRVDNWSIGVVAYELLKGVTPFKSNNEYATRANILSVKYV
ncbi:Serine/threonine-protein kinase Aurora-3 [Halotydeus destructor]|nr:Serine/threonine-protein kinase Aurora-3 [Halotydeus destructor]